MALEQKASYTYADIIDSDDEKRYELYGGTLIEMVTPGTKHQRIVGNLLVPILNYLRDRDGKAAYTRLDVRLFEKEGEERRDAVTVVQPDILIVCDPEKLDEYGVKGAPDLVMEVLSPSTARYDKRQKFHLYQKAGVKEYWIIDPEERIVTVYTLEDGLYGAAAGYGPWSEVPVGVLDGCKIDLKRVFPE